MPTWHEEIEAMQRERGLITLTLHPRSEFSVTTAWMASLAAPLQAAADQQETAA
jgi:hypothetical protein